ncbi:MAG: ATP-dependent Clp protease ATP-binding subunit [Bryobacteraceae bacterium]
MPIDPERWTNNTKAAFSAATGHAASSNHPELTPAHLLDALLQQQETTTRPLLTQVGVDPDTLAGKVHEQLSRLPRAEGGSEPGLSRDARAVLEAADQNRRDLGDDYVSVEHLVIALADQIGVTKDALLTALRAVRGNHRVTTPDPEQTYQALAKYGRDLTEAAREGKLDPVIGRDEEIRRVIQVLSRRTKNNPVLIGEPGVGKTAIVEGMAQRIADGDVPSFLSDKRILALDLSLIVAGTKYRGQFEERLKTIMKELMENQNSIIFIDELHTLVGAGSAEGSLDAANILKPALSRGEIQCIGATTPAEYRKSIEKDRSLERRFQAVKVPPPNEADAIKILFGIKERYEKFHAVAYNDDAIEAAVFTSTRFIPDRFLPDKAIDLIDEAGARVKLRQTTLPSEVAEIQKRIKFIVHRMESAIANHEFEKARFYSDEERKERENLRQLRERYNLDDTSTGVVSKDDIEDVVARWTGVPMTAIKEEEVAKLLRIEEELHKRIISQERAISALARAIRRSRAGLKSPKRPAGSFLFLGPTGVGKTEVARALADFLFGSEKSLVRFDMSEFMEKHSVSKLIGSPPGYVGYEEGGQLTERVKRQPYSVILLDEMEKAHPDVYNILLQVFEDGQLTDGIGNTVDFKNTIIIMTSNLGARFLEKKSGMGFSAPVGEGIAQKIQDMVMSEVKRAFNPEFLNRLDEVILFQSLTDEDLIQIVGLLVGQINQNLVAKQITIHLMEDAAKYILEKTCNDRSFGARPLRRALQKYIEDPLSEALIQGSLPRPAQFEIYLGDTGIYCRQVKESKEGEEVAVGAESEPAAGTPLYMF